MIRPLLAAFAAAALLSAPALPRAVADEAPAQLRVIHASPDAPAVDILVDDVPVFENLAFEAVTDYADLAAGEYTVKVVPHGASEPVVIEATLNLAADQPYSVIASGELAAIEPLVLNDDNSAPQPGHNRLRFVHAVPDAPAVDIAVKDGPVLFANIAFKDVGDYLEVVAGSYDLEVRPAGLEVVVLSLPAVALPADTVLTILAVGRLEGEPELRPLIAVDAIHGEPGAWARLRVTHAVPDAPAVDLWLNGAIVLSEVPFQAISDYLDLAAGSYRVQVSPHGASEPLLIDAELALEVGRDYTVAAIGLLEEIEAMVLEDDNSLPAAGQAHLRFVHTAPDAPAVDLAVQDGPVLFENVIFGATSDYRALPAGFHDLEVRLAGSDTVALDLPGVYLRDGTVFTVFAMGLAAGDPPLAAVPAIDAGKARVRVVHAVPDGPAVDVWVDGTVVLADLAFQDLSDYLALPAGTYNIQVTPHGASEPVVLDLDLALAAKVDYTVLASGLLADIEALALMDDNTLPAEAETHVRFVHAAPDAPAVDIALVDGLVLVAKLDFGAASDYLALAAGTYDLELRLAGTETVVLSLDGLNLVEGAVYTAFVMGLAAGEPPLTALLSEDIARPLPPLPPAEGVHIYLPYASLP